LRAGNLLVGNPEGAAALEMTLAGGTFEFETGAVIALTGADFETSVPMWTPVAVEPGGQVKCGHARSGARCYLCVNGGIDVPLVLGSASTHLLTGIGRALKRGEVLVGRTGLRPVSEVLWGRRFRLPTAGIIHVTSPTNADALCRTPWQVREDSDRMGLRLRGPALDGYSAQMLTEGVPLGAIQVPPDGQPIILFVEHQTTGGYPKIANVASADFHAVGQLRPRDQVHFEQISIDAALRLLDAQEEWLHSPEVKGEKLT
jgi:biotin-dependent carboxylase-like uncharacterized protein